MIDIHSHLLPGVDDGSSSIPQSLNQLRLMSQQGVTKLYLTPHFIRNMYHNTHNVIKPGFDQFRQAVETAQIPVKLELGCEFFMDNHALETVQQEHLTLGKSNFLLFETMMQGIPDDIFQDCYQLQKGGYKLILAHPERYLTLIRNPQKVEDFLHRDIYLQLNAGSFLGLYGSAVQRTAWYFLSQGWVHFMGSDNHGNHEKCFLQEARELIKDKLPSPALDDIFVNNAQKMEKNEKIEIFNHWRLPHSGKSIWDKLKEFFTGY